MIDTAMIDTMDMLGFGFSGPWELVIILAVVLLIFGNRIPGVARSLGRGIVEFRRGLKGEDDSDEDEPKKLEKKKSSEAEPDEDEH